MTDVYVGIIYLPLVAEENEVGGVWSDPELARESFRMVCRESLEATSEVTFRKVGNGFMEDVYCGEQRVGRIITSRVFSTAVRF
jgi:hypothetical protein